MPAAAEHGLLFAGVFLYLLAGVAICITYTMNDAETPAVLKTISI